MAASSYTEPLDILRRGDYLDSTCMPLISPSLRPIRTRGAYKLRVISGTANRDLSESIARHLTRLSQAEGSGPVCIEPCDINQFNDGEINMQICNNVRGSDIFIIQPISPTGAGVNSNLMELLLLIHTLRLSFCKRITAIVPYYAYARQDRFVFFLFLFL